jgi:spermidine synthase
MNRRLALTVSEERGVRTLHVGGEAIQSSMRLSAPYALELDYTRCMMAFLLFHPRPRRAHALVKHYGLPFPRYVPRLKRMNRHDAQQLFIVAGAA